MADTGEEIAPGCTFNDDGNVEFNISPELASFYATQAANMQSNSVIGRGGQGGRLQGLSYEEMERVLHGFMENDTNTETDGGSQAPSLGRQLPRDIPRSLAIQSATGTVQNVRGSTTMLPAANTPSTTRRPSRKRKSRKMMKLEQYFRRVYCEEHEDHVYECTACKFRVSSPDPRYRVFHCILCRNIEMDNRIYFYMATNDSQRPPLLRNPPLHCTIRQAKLLAKAEGENQSQLGLPIFSSRHDLSRDFSLTRYVIARNGVKLNNNIGNISEREKEEANNLALDFLVEENIPFAVFGWRNHFPRPLGRLLSFLRPGFKLPSLHYLKGVGLEKYYESVRKEVKRALSNTRAMQSRCTLMLGGSEDVKGQPIVNVLARISGSARSAARTYFLRSFYTGYDTCDATYYVEMVGKVVSEYSLQNCFAAVVTDNTGSVKKARECIEAANGRVCASQDQAHVADLLMKDIGEIRWISDILSSVTEVGTVLRRHRKVRAKLLELVNEFNSSLKKKKTASPNRDLFEEPWSSGKQNSCETGSNDNGSNSDHPSFDKRVDSRGENEEASVNALLADEVTVLHSELVRGAGSWQAQPISEHVISDKPQDEDVEEDQKFARMMKRVSTVRFASCEKLLFEFKSLRPVLLQLVSDECFEHLYNARNEAERTARETFKGLVQSIDFLQRVNQVHEVMRACRLYLRVFDTDTCLVSEVLLATRMLEYIIEKLPLSFFPTPREGNREHLLAVFRNRKRGSDEETRRSYNLKRVNITLVSDLHIAAALMDPWRAPYDITQTNYKTALRRHMDKYLCGTYERGSEIGGIDMTDSITRDNFIDAMLYQYDKAHNLWIQKYYVRNVSEATTIANAVMRCELGYYSKTAAGVKPGESPNRDERNENRFVSSSTDSRSPISWWNGGPKFADVHDQYSELAAKELIEYAVRTLSISPTATPTERTFSHLARIQPKQRASLSNDHVSKLLFCQWNLREIRRITVADNADRILHAKAQMEGMNKLYDLRSASKARHESFQGNDSTLSRQNASNQERRRSEVHEVTVQTSGALEQRTSVGNTETPVPGGSSARGVNSRGVDIGKPTELEAALALIKKHGYHASRRDAGTEIGSGSRHGSVSKRPRID